MVLAFFSFGLACWPDCVIYLIIARNFPFTQKILTENLCWKSCALPSSSSAAPPCAPQDSLGPSPSGRVKTSRRAVPTSFPVLTRCDERWSAGVASFSRSPAASIPACKSGQFHTLGQMPEARMQTWLSVRTFSAVEKLQASLRFFVAGGSMSRKESATVGGRLISQ